MNSTLQKHVLHSTAHIKENIIISVHQNCTELCIIARKCFFWTVQEEQKPTRIIEGKFLSNDVRYLYDIFKLLTEYWYYSRDEIRIYLWLTAICRPVQRPNRKCSLSLITLSLKLCAYPQLMCACVFVITILQVDIIHVNLPIRFGQSVAMCCVIRFIFFRVYVYNKMESLQLFCNRVYRYLFHIIISKS